ncbi:MAG: 50S ribosomal protein L31e [Candidatus Micrarchaeota archaeon]|nr:50S ribosomal protein L31e [Candidatus Micrarchaeota archaeon]
MERVYTIPLRKAFRAPRTRRAKKAIKIIREFLERHMKGEVRIGKSINESVWARGIQKPPRRVKIHAVKEDGVIYAELVGVEIKKPVKKEEKEKPAKERKKKKLEEEIKEEKEKSKGREAKVKEGGGEEKAEK